MDILINDFNTDNHTNDNFKIESIDKNQAMFYQSDYGSKTINTRLAFSPTEFISDWFLNSNLTKMEFLNLINQIIQPI